MHISTPTIWFSTRAAARLAVKERTDQGLQARMVDLGPDNAPRYGVVYSLPATRPGMQPAKPVKQSRAKREGLYAGKVTGKHFRCLHWITKRPGIYPFVC